METKLISGLSQVQSKYDTFFIDLWGVIHNGIELYPEAINVLKKLNKLKKRFVLISNAPRPSKSVENYLTNLDMDKAFIKNVFTSQKFRCDKVVRCQTKAWQQTFDRYEKRSKECYGHPANVREISKSKKIQVYGRG